MQVSERSPCLSVTLFSLPFIAGQFVHVSSRVLFILFTQMMLNSRQVSPDVLTGGVCWVCVSNESVLTTNGNCSKLWGEKKKNKKKEKGVM